MKQTYEKQELSERVFVEQELNGLIERTLHLENELYKILRQ